MIYIHWSVGRSVGQYVCRLKKSGGITWPKCACSKSDLGSHNRPTVYLFRLYARAALALMKKKRSLRNGKLKQTERASENRGKKG